MFDRIISVKHSWQMCVTRAKSKHVFPFVAFPPEAGTKLNQKTNIHQVNLAYLQIQRERSQKCLISPGSGA